MKAPEAVTTAGSLTLRTSALGAEVKTSSALLVLRGHPAATMTTLRDQLYTLVEAIRRHGEAT